MITHILKVQHVEWPISKVLEERHCLVNYQFEKVRSGRDNWQDLQARQTTLCASSTFNNILLSVESNTFDR